MQVAILNIINLFGYLGIFFLIALENIFPPIPSEIILTFGGFATTMSHLNIWGVIIAATSGSVVGALILYLVGYLLDYKRLTKLFNSRLGRILHLNLNDLKRTKQWFTKYGYQTVFFGRFIPIVRSLVSIPAGINKMRLDVFLLLTVSGTLIWNIVLVYLGKYAGENWQTVVTDFQIYYKLILIIVLVVIIVIVIYRKLISNKKK